MLGTNDLKFAFDRSPAEIAEALDGYVEVVQTQAASREGEPPAVVLVSPPHIDDTCRTFAARRGASYERTSVAKSRLLADHLEAMAQARAVSFLNAASVAWVGEDGVHLAREAHRTLAERLADTVRSLSRATPERASSGQ